MFRVSPQHWRPVVLALLVLLLLAGGGFGHRRWRAARAAQAAREAALRPASAAAAVVLEHRCWTEPGGHYFAGTIGTLGPVQIRVDLDEDSYVWGRCRWERSGQRVEISGRWLAGGSTQLDIPDRRGPEATDVTLLGKMVGEPPAFEGRWLGAAGQSEVPVRLRHVAARQVFVCVSGRSPLGAASGRAMHRIEAAYPVFPRSNDFLCRANERLQRETREIAIERLHETAVEGYLTDLDEVEGPTWISAVDWEIDFAAGRAVSLLARRYEYEGGAHGTRWFRTQTLVDSADGPDDVALADLFPPGSAGPKRVAALCVEDLQRQYGGDFIEESFANGDRQEALEMVSRGGFTLSAAGLHCLFAPEELSYSHTESEVIIPFAVLRPYLRRAGPAALFGAAKP